MNNTIQAKKQQVAIGLHGKIDSTIDTHASKTMPARVNMVTVKNSIQIEIGAELIRRALARKVIHSFRVMRIRAVENTCCIL
ncbi:MAG: hypothetical protein HKP41_07905 [Desulfobacterales bacterium]|nr:hypothetical protein [Deltaproteobacteria bacterium]NNK94259.1 hypothetical protein [Desulfobacterales bacterium]RZW13901.1 MAG: hypothetical protein EX260_11070 [Desulfobulbaceae bacterium]